MKLERISYLEYYNLISSNKGEDYTYNIKFNRHFSNPIDVYSIGDFTKLTFGEVKDYQYTFSNGFHLMTVIEFIASHLGKDVKEIVTFDLLKICNFKAFIENQIDRITKIEQSLMYSTTVEDESAGMNNLAKFGVSIQIDSLANGRVWMWDKVRAEPYMRCFTKLLMDKEIKEYQREINKPKN